MSDSESQQRLVLWGYIIQWTTVIMPVTLIASAIYVLLVRGRVANVALRSHLDWQLATAGIAILVALLAGVLFFVGLSGVSTDAPLAIIATYTVLGLAAVLPLWMLYRLLHGTLQFSKKLPMQNLFL